MTYLRQVPQRRELRLGFWILYIGTVFDISTNFNPSGEVRGEEIEIIVFKCISSAELFGMDRRRAPHENRITNAMDQLGDQMCSSLWRLRSFRNFWWFPEWMDSTRCVCQQTLRHRCIEGFRSASRRRTHSLTRSGKQASSVSHTASQRAC